MRLRKDGNNMALLYHRATVNVETKDVTIRPIDEEDHHVAITFTTDEEDEEAVTEVLLSRDEVQEAYDLLFNR